MYIRLTDSTLRENEYLFRLNDQQKVYYQPKQYANYQLTALAFSPSIKEQYMITIIISCLQENNGKRQ